MKKIYSVKEIQNIEKKEFKKLKSSYVLMKRAGTNCAKKIYKSKLNRKFIVLCGAGNNGGDGFRLANMIDDCFVVATHDKQKTPLAQRARDDWKGTIHTVETLPEQAPAVIVDCLLGAGTYGQPRGEIIRLMEAIPGRPMVLACDMPTGCGSGDRPRNSSPGRSRPELRRPSIRSLQCDLPHVAARAGAAGPPDA